MYVVVSSMLRLVDSRAACSAESCREPLCDYSSSSSSLSQQEPGPADVGDAGSASQCSRITDALRSALAVRAVVERAWHGFQFMSSQFSVDSAPGRRSSQYVAACGRGAGGEWDRDYSGFRASCGKGRVGRDTDGGLHYGRRRRGALGLRGLSAELHELSRHARSHRPRRRA